jgi:hypothetical protein
MSRDQTHSAAAGNPFARARELRKQHENAQAERESIKTLRRLGLSHASKRPPLLSFGKSKVIHFENTLDEVCLPAE